LVEIVVVSVRAEFCPGKMGISSLGFLHGRKPFFREEIGKKLPMDRIT